MSPAVQNEPSTVMQKLKCNDEIVQRLPTPEHQARETLDLNW